MNFIQIHLYSLMQTLVTLNLAKNDIGSKEVQYLASEFPSNKVNSWFYVHLFHAFSYRFIQTLTIIELGYNIIGVEEVQFLANALQNNTVRKVPNY